MQDRDRQVTQSPQATTSYMPKSTPKIGSNPAQVSQNEQRQTPATKNLQTPSAPVRIMSDNNQVLLVAQNFFFSQNEPLIEKFATRDLQITSDNKLIFHIENALEENFVRNKREALLRVMKEETGRIFEMQFEMKKSTQPAVRRLDTNAAKMQYLAGKNPILDDLIKKLGLEPD